MASQQGPEIPCHISDKAAQDPYSDYIREWVCRDLKTSPYTDGNHYCHLHLPYRDKNLREFDFIFRSRLKEVEDKVAELPEKEERGYSRVSYDFHYVWFPKGVDLAKYQFVAPAEFHSAEFWGTANFKSATFTKEADFNSAVFLGGASFSFAKFLGYTVFSSVFFWLEADFWFAEFAGELVFKSAFIWSDTIFTSAKFLKKTNFDSTKFVGNAVFASAKFSDAVDFSSAMFVTTNFESAEFSGIANFSSAEFLDTGYFSEARFSGVGSFVDTIFFGEARFEKTMFMETSEVFFQRTEFCGNASFSQAMFEGFISFEGSRKDKVFFDRQLFRVAEGKLKAEFANGVNKLSKLGVEMEIPEITLNKENYEQMSEKSKEEGGEVIAESYEDFMASLEKIVAILDLQNARLKNPERISFHTVRLRPGWFVNTDSRTMVFTDCRWDNIKKDTFWKFLTWENIKNRTSGEVLRRWWKNEGINAELNALIEREIPEEKRLLEIACRQLAVNAEENNRYEEAMGFRYMAMDAHRREKWWRRWLPVTLHWWYWASSGYGERALRALIMLLLVWVIPFLFYISPWAVFAQGSGAPPAEQTVSTGKPGLEALEAAFYSLNVMAFQKPDPKPANESPLTRGVVTLQTILGPVQAALLLLAIRRKFMR